MANSQIPEKVWDEIKHDFLKQIGIAIIDYTTFRNILTEEDIEEIVPSAIRSIAWTDSGYKLETISADLSKVEKKEIRNNLVWAIVEGYLIAASVEYQFHLKELKDHCLKIEEWIKETDGEDSTGREWKMYNFAKNEGLKILYSKRPVARMMIEELIGSTPIIAKSKHVSLSRDKSAEDEVLHKGMVLCSLIGASLFEFERDIHQVNRKKLNWLQRANAILGLKPNIAGVGLNINALLDSLKSKNSN